MLVFSARHDDAKAVASSTRNSLGAMVAICTSNDGLYGRRVEGAFSMMGADDVAGNPSREKEVLSAEGILTLVRQIM